MKYKKAVFMKRFIYAMLALFAAGVALSCSSSSSGPSGPDVYAAYNLSYAGSFTYTRTTDNSSVSYAIPQHFLPNSFFIHGGNYYTAGKINIGNGSEIAAAWEGDNITIIERPSGSGISEAHSVAVASDGAVYTAGYYYRNLTRNAALWKDGVLQPTETLNNTADSSARFVYTANNTVYMAGYVTDSGAHSATLWVDGVLALLDVPTGSSSEAMCLTVSEEGVRYVVGKIDEKAVLWIDNIWQELDIPSGTISSIAQSVLLFNDVTYVAGIYNNGTENVAAYWADGVRTDLVGSNNISNFDVNIAVNQDEDVYVMVYGGNESEMWKNGVPEKQYDRRTLMAATGNIIYTGEYRNPISMPTVWNRGGIKYFVDTAEGNYIHSIAVSGNDIYTAGLDYNNQPVVWKGREKNVMEINAGSAGHINSLAISQDGSVYAAGTDMAATVLWKDGYAQPVDISACSGMFTGYDAALSGVDVYVAGLCDIVAVVWHNNAMSFVPDYNGQSALSAYAVAVADGVVYTGATYPDTAVVWSGGAPLEMARPSAQAPVTLKALAIAKDGSVYAGGYYQVDGKSAAAMWRDGMAQQLSIPSDALSSTVGSVTLSPEGAVYAAGMYCDANGVIRAAIWENGSLITIGNGVAASVHR